MASADAALSIMEEFLRSSEPQVRQNVLTALSVVDDPAGAKLMAEAALSDKDNGVRKKALDEIAALDEGARSFAIKVFADALEAEDEERQQRAYFLLGQLRDKEVSIHDVRVPPGKGMRLAASLVTRTFLARNWLYRLRGWRYGFWGTLLASVVFLLYAVEFYDATKYVNAALGVAAAEAGVIGMGILLAVFATQFSAPISLQLSRLHALFVELITSLTGSVVGMLLLFTLLGGILKSLLYWERIGDLVLIVIIPACGLLAVVVRFGTIIGFWYGGKRFGGMRKRVRMFEILYGAMMGFAATSVAFFFYYWTNIRFQSYSRVELNFFTSLWLASGAVAVGLANAFAKIDSEGPPE